MSLLDALERMLLRHKRGKERIDLKEIFCKRSDDDFIESFRTAAVGVEYSNIDGSDRQEALKKIKVGNKVRLIWDSGDSGDKDTVYLVRKGAGQELSMPDCFGRLSDKVAADVIRWLTKENVVTSAKVAKITGGTRKRPRLGCVLEMRTYPGPKKEEKS
ncbi:MAG: hypothetical protein PVG78_04880 [Desulfobacterales bacterium]|jgi:hypothetical protein